MVLYWNNAIESKHGYGNHVTIRKSFLISPSQIITNHNSISTEIKSNYSSETYYIIAVMHTHTHTHTQYYRLSNGWSFFAYAEYFKTISQSVRFIRPVSDLKAFKRGSHTVATPSLVLCEDFMVSHRERKKYQKHFHSFSTWNYMWHIFMCVIETAHKQLYETTREPSALHFRI